MGALVMRAVQLAVSYGYLASQTSAEQLSVIYDKHSEYLE